MLRYERQAWDRGVRRLAGVDEVGRGPLAGPVIAAAVVFDSSYLESQISGELAGLTDSKKLSPSRRETFYDIIMSSPGVQVAFGRAESSEIDEINILRATHAAMKRALDGLPQLPDHALIDGLPVPGLPCPSTAIIKGDSLSISIAAASVVSKVTRDREMVALDRKYPGYGFARHKGYGTLFHTKALLQRGPCPIHRMSFQPVMDAFQIRRLQKDRGERDGE